MADFKLAIPIIKRSEGGLSKAKTDTASKNPVPDGSGYHTNKGITWTTFTENAKRLGYVATPKLFYEMPEGIWQAITKFGYWDRIQGDKLHSQAVATILVDWYFGSGNWAVKNLQSVLNTKFNYKLLVDGDFGLLTLKAANSVNQKDLLHWLYQARLAFIDKISKNGNQIENKKGWLDDAKYTYEKALQYLPKVGGALAAAAAIFF